MAVDGTGHHSSGSVKCRNRRVKHQRDGTRTCHHRTFGAAIIHPDLKKVPPPDDEHFDLKVNMPGLVETGKRERRRPSRAAPDAGGPLKNNEKKF